MADLAGYFSIFCAYCFLTIKDNKLTLNASKTSFLMRATIGNATAQSSGQDQYPRPAQGLSQTPWA